MATLSKKSPLLSTTGTSLQIQNSNNAYVLLDSDNTQSSRCLLISSKPVWYRTRTMEYDVCTTDGRVSPCVLIICSVFQMFADFCRILFAIE